VLLAGRAGGRSGGRLTRLGSRAGPSAAAPWYETRLASDVGRNWILGVVLEKFHVLARGCF
jgi:hypothetical protein